MRLELDLDTAWPTASHAGLFKDEITAVFDAKALEIFKWDPKQEAKEAEADRQKARE